MTKHVYIPHKCGIGYFQICTSINGKRKNIKVHKAVAESFIDNPCNLPVINHIDGNKENNNVENLEWCTYQDNSDHAWNIGLMENCKKNCECLSHDFYGEQNGMSKLTDDDVRYIRKNYITKGKGKKCNRVELAEKFNVTPILIYKVYKREIWKHVE